MSIDRIYREFIGVTLVICSIFLFISLITFSPEDDVLNYLPGETNYVNTFGYLGALFSSSLMAYLGHASYYLILVLTYFGVILFISKSSKNFVEKISTFNKFLLCLISIFPFALFLSAFFEDMGGLVGHNLFNSSSVFLDSIWLGSLSLIIFIIFQYFVFSEVFGLISASNMTTTNTKDKSINKSPSSKKTDKKVVKKTDAAKHTESKESQINVPKDNLKEQEDFLHLLDQEIDESADISKEYLEDLSSNLVVKLEEFGIEGKVEDALPGPVITRFEIILAPGTKASQVTNIANDLARSLAVKSVRVVEVIEGKSSIGIEIPNPKRKVVTLYSAIHEHPKESLKPLEFCIGRDISGESSKIDLQQLPHLLIAGTTGSGKSVGVNTILLNLLRNNSPNDLRLLLIDPKMLELSVYDDLPHLITPVITDMQKAANGLNWCVKEMDKRYKLMSALGVRSLESYNQKVQKINSISEEIKEKLFEINDGVVKPLPYIVIVIDELADLMMVAGKKVEQLISRLAQKARASGMHLVVSTQRPSVDVITGLIKANIPSRISFLVSSKIDSRTILDQGGAEQLLGNGDMLFVEPGTSIPNRIHGAFVSDDEVQKIAKFLRETGKPDYIEDVIKSVEVQELSEEADMDDDLYNEAVEFVVETRRASISSVQRKFRIGYNRAARLIETMEENGIVSPMNSNGSREVL